MPTQSEIMATLWRRASRPKIRGAFRSSFQRRTFGNQHHFKQGFTQQPIEPRALEQVEAGEIENILLCGAEAIDIGEVGAAIQRPFLAFAQVRKGHFLAAARTAGRAD